MTGKEIKILIKAKRDVYEKYVLEDEDLMSDRLFERFKSAEAVLTTILKDIEEIEEIENASKV